VVLGSFDLGERTLSNATMQAQALPFAFNIIVERGCDYMIMELIEELHEQVCFEDGKDGNAGATFGYRTYYRFPVEDRFLFSAIENPGLWLR
jgi:hypothetical protein